MSAGTPIAISPDAAEITRAIETLHSADALVEVRAIYRGGRRKRTDCGYFEGARRGELVREAVRLNTRGAAVYVTLNEIDSQLLGRYANRIEEFAEKTTGDSNITRRRWLPLDIDPQRPADTAATDAQLELARQRAQQIRDYLATAGWTQPIIADSGNGVHLLYRIDLPNNTESAELVKQCLAALAARFDDERIKLDCSVFNAARIIKLHGTIANKGDNHPSTPWRLSRLTEIPEAIDTPVRIELLRALAAEVSGRNHKHKHNESAAPSAHAWSEAGVQAFLARGGLEAVGPDAHEGALRWKLKTCPFNPEHGFGEAAVFLRPDGRLGFECFHNSCQDKHWADLRRLVDGDPEQRTRNTRTIDTVDDPPDDGVPFHVPDAIGHDGAHDNGTANGVDETGASASLDLRSFTRTDILAPIQPERFLLPGVPAEAYTLIAGALSSFKTSFLVYLLVWKATGFDLLDLDPHGNGIEVGKAVLLTYEDTDTRIFAKLQRVVQHGYENILRRDGQRDADRFVERAAANIRRISLAGKAGMGLMRRFEGGVILPNLSFLENFFTGLRAFAPEGALIALDPLRLALVGSQSDDDGADIAVHTLNRLATEVPGCGVIAASHTTKAGAQEGASGYAAASYATSGSALYSQHARSNFHMARLTEEQIRELFDPAHVTPAEGQRQLVAKLTHGRLSHGVEQSDRYVVMRNGLLMPVRLQSARSPVEQLRAVAGPIVSAIDAIKADGLRASKAALENNAALVKTLGSVPKLRVALKWLADDGYLELAGTTSDRNITVTSAGRVLVGVESHRKSPQEWTP